MQSVRTKHNKIYAPLKNRWLPLSAQSQAVQLLVHQFVVHFEYQESQMEQDFVYRANEQDCCFDLVIWKTPEERLKGKSPFVVADYRNSLDRTQCEEVFEKALRIKAKFCIVSNGEESRYFQVGTQFQNSSYRIVEIINDIKNRTTRSFRSQAPKLDRYALRMESLTQMQDLWAETPPADQLLDLLNP
jgi:Type I restriction enzyme R protein N terminus (HSDR_N)